MPKKMIPPKIAAVDVFCGAAGLSFGLQASGIMIAAGIDVDPDCRYPFEANIGSPFIEKDVSLLGAPEIDGLYPSGCVRVLAGCAPCQPFSRYTTKRRDKDDRWRLLLDFLRLADGVRPEILTLENVPGLAGMPLWTEFVQELEFLGYSVSWDTVDASRYGVPQRRRRLVLLASLLGQIQMPKQQKGAEPTVRSAIGAFVPVKAGRQSKLDVLHRSRALTPLNLSRIKASKPAGTWREWPDAMKVACHVNGQSRYPSVYGRMSWDKPSPTITTQFYGFGNGRFGHPEQHRALTLREGASLQSFPADYLFVEPGERVSFNRIGKLIGNAVPPALACAIGNEIRAHVAQVSK